MLKFTFGFILAVFVAIFNIFPELTYGQISIQQVRGIIRDQVSQEPLIGASVQLEDTTLIIGTITDFSGEFVLDNVPLGRIRIRCDYLGYVAYISPPFVLSAARSPYMEIEMEESNVQLDEIVIKEKRDDARPQNELALLSGRSFVAEETERYAGSIADPSRMAVSFAGVQASNDLDNDIIVRGNSSVGLLWRLEGIDIPNPNHFARRGSSGGGISIFSVNILRNSDFIYGTLPAEYGNTLSSVFDMKLRKGNDESHDYSIRAGLLGLDLIGEGPISKNKSSYLFNYRYSTLGLLNQVGIHLVDKNTDNNFMDLAYHIFAKSSDNKNIIQGWGIGGVSSEIHHPIDDPLERKEFEDLVYTDFSTRMGVAGINWTRIFNNQSYLKLKVAYMGNQITHAKDTVDSEHTRGFLLNEEYTTYRLTTSFEFNKRYKNSLNVKSGIVWTGQSYDLFYKDLERYTGITTQYLDHKGNNAELHFYAQGSANLHRKLFFTGGIHFYHNSINEDESIDPRIAVN